MSARLSLNDILGSVSTTYKSVDIRTISVNVSSKWYNLVTVVRFSDAGVDDFTQRIQEEWSKHESVDSDELKIGRTSLPIAQLDSMVHAFEEGTLSFYGYPVTLERSVKLRESMGYITRSGNFVDSEWPSFEGNESWSPDNTNQQLIATAQKLRYFAHDQNLWRHIETRGYTSFKDVMHVFLDSRAGAEPSYCSDVFVSAPVFARIQSASIEPAGEKLTVPFRAHPALVSSMRIHGAAVDRHNKSERLSFAVQAEIEEGEWKAEASYRSRDTEGRIDARIVHEKLGEIYSYGWTVRELVPRHELSPLWHVLRRFCSPDKLEKLLREPASLPDDQGKPQRLFEQHVAWLLACYSFATIVLGGHEHLYQPGTKIRRGSLDVVAFHSGSRILLLASCTLNPPKEEDYSNLLNLRALLLEEIEGDVTFTTSMAIFTAAAACGSPKAFSTDEIFAHPDSVNVFDAPSMQAAVRGLEQKEDVFLKQLAGSWFLQ
jgi:hypothetical protein